MIIAFFKGFTLFCCKVTVAKGTTPNSTLQLKLWRTRYLGILLYFIMFFGYNFVVKGKRLHPETADLYSGKATIYAEES